MFKRWSLPDKFFGLVQLKRTSANSLGGLCGVSPFDRYLNFMRIELPTHDDAL
jgi:hypothetical protein